MIRSTVIALIRIGRVKLLPFGMGACRFTPSSSQYAIEAVRKHGVIRGVWLMTQRLSRCHGWSAGGDDPVP